MPELDIEQDSELSIKPSVIEADDGEAIDLETFRADLHKMVESMGGGGGWYGGASGTGGGLNSAGGGGSSYAYTTELYYLGTSQTIASYYPTTYEGQDSYMPNTDYLLEEVSSISGSYVKTVAEDKYSKSTIEGARNAAWGVHGHARITILLE